MSKLKGDDKAALNCTGLGEKMTLDGWSGVCKLKYVNGMVQNEMYKVLKHFPSFCFEIV